MEFGLILEKMPEACEKCPMFNSIGLLGVFVSGERGRCRSPYLGLTLDSVVHEHDSLRAELCPLRPLETKDGLKAKLVFEKPDESCKGCQFYRFQYANPRTEVGYCDAPGRGINSRVVNYCAKKGDCPLREVKNN